MTKRRKLGNAACTVVSVVVCVIATSTLFGQQAGNYPSARHGGNYMFNFYFPPAPSATPWAPSWSPDGNWIAIGMSGSIWKVDPKTGAAHELTYNETYHALPDWSPDGTWIIYTADADGATIQLEILNVETGETRALTDDSFIYTDPVFSPDGATVAYVSTKPDGHFNVYVRPIRDGRWAGDEVAVTSDNSYGSNRLYFGEWDMHITPRLASERRGAAPRVEPRGAARVRQRCSDAARRQRDRERADGTRRADALPHAPRRVDRREAVRLFVDTRRGRTSSTTSTCNRPRAVSRTSSPFSATMRSTRAGRPTASGSPTSRMVPGCPSSRCSRPTGVRTRRSVSLAGTGSARWACCRSERRPPRPAA